MRARGRWWHPASVCQWPLARLALEQAEGVARQGQERARASSVAPRADLDRARQLHGKLVNFHSSSRVSASEMARVQFAVWLLSSSGVSSTMNAQHRLGFLFNRPKLGGMSSRRTSAPPQSSRRRDAATKTLGRGKIAAQWHAQHAGAATCNCDTKPIGPGRDHTQVRSRQTATRRRGPNTLARSVRALIIRDHHHHHHRPHPSRWPLKGAICLFAVVRLLWASIKINRLARHFKPVANGLE